MTSENSAPNPYESPKAANPNHAEDAEPWLGTYNPVVAPQDALDVLMGGGAGTVVAVLVYAIPFGVVTFFQLSIAWYGAFVLMILVVAVLAMVVGIRKIELTQDEIIATRRLLPPLRIPWRDVVSIENVNRGAVLLVAFVVPHRCCSYSLTSRDQVRIDAGRIRIVFPPQNLTSFRGTVQAMAAQHHRAGIV